MGLIPPSRLLPWHPTHRIIEGTPEVAESRAYSWQYWQGILLIPAWTRWLNGIGCSTSLCGAHGRDEKPIVAAPLTNKSSATGIRMRFIVPKVHTTTRFAAASHRCIADRVDRPFANIATAQVTGRVYVVNLPRANPASRSPGDRPNAPRPIRGAPNRKDN